MITYARHPRPSDEKRRARDIAFLATLRTAGALELLAMRRALVYSGPEWKFVAVCRAIVRLGRST